MRLPLLLASSLLIAACSAGRMAPPAYPDRIVGADEGGNLIRERGVDERARVTFPAKLERVFQALAGAYTELGVPANLVDPAEHRYGNVGFVLPNEFAGGNVRDYFECGSDITGPLVGRGRLVATIVTTLSAADSTTTRAATQVTGSLRRMDGTSTKPTHCASTGKIEALIRRGVEARLN